MIHLLILTPILAACLILAGAPARKTALLGSLFAFALSLLAFALFNVSAKHPFDYVSTWAVLPEWKLNFTVGLDGLSLVMVLLSTIVTVAAVWFTGKIDHSERGFYACLLLISAGALGAFSSLDLFFFYAFHELALIPTFLLIGIWGSGNRSAAAWKTKA